MKIEVTGEALKVLEDFIKYSQLDPAAVASAMMYDVDAFKRRIALLQKAIERGADHE